MASGEYWPNEGWYRVHQGKAYPASHSKERGEKVRVVHGHTRPLVWVEVNGELSPVAADYRRRDELVGIIIESGYRELHK